MTDIPGNSRLHLVQAVPATPQLIIDTGDTASGLDTVLATLWRGKWIILFTTILAVLLGAHHAFIRTTPLYTSTAVVMLETQQDHVAGLESIVSGLTGDTSEISSEVQVFQSRVLLG